jgi:hypothetical protein
VSSYFRKGQPVGVVKQQALASKKTLADINTAVNEVKKSILALRKQAVP